MKNETIKQNIGNLIIAICVGMSCLFVMLNAGTLTFTSIVQWFYLGLDLRNNIKKVICERIVF